MENEKELRVLEAAKAVFLRYGFRRVTMQDISEEAGISRPALYLIFPNKEEIFKAAAVQMAAESFATIRAALPTLPTLEARLNYAFEVWTVHPFQMMLTMPDARDLVECTQGFARETVDKTLRQFEELLVQILEPPVPSSGTSLIPPAQLAHLLAASTHGFKSSAASVDELRTMIAGLITLTLAALEAPARHGP